MYVCIDSLAATSGLRYFYTQVLKLE